MKYFFSMTIAVLLLGTACTEKHLITDETTRKQIATDFRSKQDLFAQNKDLFSVFEKDLSMEEKEALMFLYAYMPIADITNNDGDYFLRQVRSSLQVKEEMAWGQSLPEQIFRHFVLPVRVNNEDLDEARIIFYNELKERLQGLSMYDAVLEVNHWCHEKVVYAPTDGRTIAPLACVKTAQGRCGEESTFTVTALRSVGIPARQIYTPRWAHTDSNHAWVEAWIDGQWYFFGACEPEPVLNLGWFNEPAFRAMLLHTRVFGKYNGPEEIMTTTANFTEINVLENYAPTSKGTVTIVDSENKPIEGVDVEFKIYNSADFFTVATKQTDSEGKCSLTAGKGDLFIWASKNGKTGYGKLSFGKEDNLIIVLDKVPGETVAFEMDIVPPVGGTIPAEVTDEQKEKNARRLAEEDEIRNAYVSTFCTADKAKALAEKLTLNEEAVTDFLLTSRGNWQTIGRFLEEAPAEKRKMALALLGVISRKDLQDVSLDVLNAHLNETIGIDDENYVRYVLNPRVSTELLTVYKKQLQEAFTPEFIQNAQQNPQEIVLWCNKELTLIDEQNPQRIMAGPVGIMRAKVCDAGSRDLFFVSLCRSFGIPARIEQATRKIQYFTNGIWNDVNFTGEQHGNAKQGWVAASYQPNKILPDPVYGNHYSISKIVDGKLQSQYYRGAQGRWSQLLKNPKRMDVGNYMLTTGTRMANGGILIRIDFFNVEEEQTIQTELIMRENKNDVQVIGNIDAEAMYLPVGENTPVSVLSTTGRGYFIIGILGVRQEPTNHALKDIEQVASGFEEWGRTMILLFPNERNMQMFDKDEFKGLPKTIVYGLDSDAAIADMIVKAMNLPNASSLPIFIVADTFGRVVFVSQGYTIGLGEQIMNVTRRL